MSVCWVSQRGLWLPCADNYYLKAKGPFNEDDWKHLTVRAPHPSFA